MAYRLHDRLAQDTLPVGHFPLCELRMMNDANYPWFILVPRREGLRELHELDEPDARQFWAESRALATALMAAFDGHKFNLAALGNVVPQLHVHHIVRQTDDPAWPGPVWGAVPPRPLAAAEVADRWARLRTVSLPELDRAAAD